MADRHPIRSFIVLMLSMAWLVPSAGVAAQATPLPTEGNPFADLGLPQIDIVMTDNAFEGVPGQLDAGRYSVSFTNDTSESFGTMGGAFMQIPAEMTVDEFLAMAAPMDEESMSEEVEAAASPAGDDDGFGIPEWYYQVTIAGGPYAPAGQTTYAVVDLTAGDWVFWAEYPGAPQAPIAITVSGEMPADLPAPAADVRIEMDEFFFGFSTPLTSATRVIEVANVGEQPHFLSMAMLPAGTTVEDLLSVFEAAMSEPEDVAPEASPEGGLSLEEIPDFFNIGDQAAGVTAWYSINVEPGTVGAVCFVTDPESGMPHAMLGMVEVFEVN